MIGREARAPVSPARAAATRTPSWPASAAARTRSASSPRTSRPRVRALRRRGRRARLRGRASTPRGSREDRSASSTGRARCSSRTRRARRCRRTRSRRASTIPRSGPSTPRLHDAGRVRYTKVSDDRGARRLRASLRDRGDPSGARVRARRRLRRAAWRATAARSRGSWSISRGAATRTSTRYLRVRGADRPVSRHRARRSRRARRRGPGRVRRLPHGGRSLGGGDRRASPARSSERARTSSSSACPFSDPIADGPVLQRAASRALAAGTTLDVGLRHRAAHPRRDARWRSSSSRYVNPLHRMGIARAARRGAEPPDSTAPS